jgi:hypothetical protein
MPLQRQVISWPLTGGLDSKTSPLMIQPGSHLALDNVRQERANEWRARNGTGKDVLDTLPNSLPPLVLANPGGASGLLALSTPGAPSSTTIVVGYMRRPGGGAWVPLQATVNAITQCGLGSLASITRRAVFPTFPATASVPGQLSCANNGTISAIRDFGPNNKSSLVVESSTDQTVASANSVIGSSAIAVNGLTANTTLRAKIAYATNGSLFITVRIATSGAVTVLRNSATAGLVGETTIGADAHLTIPHVDIFQYSGSSTITIVYRTSTASTWRIVEYNAATDTISSNISKAVNCDNCLCLLPDPDASGTRFVALSSSTPTVSVLRIDSTGTTLTTDAVDTKAATQIAGCAYQAGASWMIVYQTATGIFGAKKLGGTVGTVKQMYSDLRITLHSNAFRQVSTDSMMYAIGYHGPVADPQDHYFLVQQYYDSSSTAMIGGIVNGFPQEPFAKLLPFDAGPALATPATLPHVPLMSTGVYELPLVRASRISLSPAGTAGTVQETRYSADVFTVTILSAANKVSQNIGSPRTIGSAALIPIGALFEVSEGVVISAHGLNVAPPAPVVTPSVGAGALTLLATYQWLVIYVARNDAGEEWRSPPSIPTTVTLTGGQNTASVAFNGCVELENAFRQVTAEVYRTKANGSIFQKVASVTGTPAIFATSVSDIYSDASMNAGADFAYAQPGTATQPTTLTPPMSHVETFAQRLWGINRDYRQQLWFTKKFAQNRSPEFVGAFQISMIDEEGDMTNIAQLDDKLIVFKKSAIYFVQGDGPDEAGSGSYPTATRVDSDVGSIVGSPVVSTGQEVYFVSTRGIYMVDRSLQVKFIGQPVDQYLNQPLVQARETVIGAVFSSATNEVRFQTTNYRLVYDRLRGLWYRDTGAGMQNVVSTCMVGSKQALFKSDGTMWVEGDETVKQDAGVSFVPSIRSAWIRPAGTDGRLRLYMARVIMTRTAGGASVTPSMSIFYDNDDSIVETFTPAAIGGATLVSRGSVQPRRHRCSAFSLLLTLPGNDVSLRLDAWGAEVGMRSGAFRNNSGTAERWT